MLIRCSLTGSPSSDTWGTNPLYSPNSISLRDTHCCSVTKSYQTLKPHGLQHARLPSPLLSPAVWSSLCLLSRWCHPAISSSVAPFSSCLQSFPASGSFPMSQLFSSGGQRIGALASVLPLYYQSEGTCVFDKLRLIEHFWGYQEDTSASAVKLHLSLGVQSPLTALHKVEPHTAERISKQHRTSQSCGETGPGTGPGSPIC